MQAFLPSLRLLVLLLCTSLFVLADKKCGNYETGDLLCTSLFVLADKKCGNYETGDELKTLVIESGKGSDTVNPKLKYLGRTDGSQPVPDDDEDDKLDGDNDEDEGKGRPRQQGPNPRSVYIQGISYGGADAPNEA
jgi:hypothetical protein